MLPLPDCLNCGATLDESDVSSRKKFARCSFCLTLLNVRGYFNSNGKERIWVVELEDLQAARNALGRLWLMPVMTAGKVMAGACALMYFPFVLITMFQLTGGHDPMPRIIGFLVAATLLPMVVLGVGWALVRRHIERNPVLSSKAQRRARVLEAMGREKRGLEARRRMVAEVACAKCGVSLVPEAIDLEMRHAKCSYCGHEFDVKPQLQEPVDQEQAKRVIELRGLEAKFDARETLLMRALGVGASLALLAAIVTLIGPLRAFHSNGNIYFQLLAAFLSLGLVGTVFATIQTFMLPRRTEERSP